MKLAQRVFACGWVLAVLAGCEPEAPSVSTVVLTANPLRINDKDQAASLAVQVTDAMGKPGTGTVLLRAHAGKLENGSNQQTLTLDAGRADSSFTCSLADDSACRGLILIEAEWNNTTGSVLIGVGEPVVDAGPDDGGADAGRDAGTPGDSGVDAGVPDAGPDAGRGDGTVLLALAASKSPMFFNVGDFSDMTATLLAPDGGPKASEDLIFSATLGGFGLPDGGIVTPLTVQTNTQGVARARLHDTPSSGPGVATVTVLHDSTVTYKSVNVEISSVQQISWVSTTCGGNNCTILGIKGSGFNEQAQMTFKVVDSSNRDAPGVTVRFSISQPPQGTTVGPEGVTNSAGLVTINVSSGTGIGIFTIRADVLPNVYVNSPTLGVRGAKPSNQGFGLQCLPVNNPVYVSPAPPARITVPCRVSLVDRYNNPIGNGTSVLFKSEAGKVPNTVATEPFDPGGTNTDEGTADFTFSSEPPFPALDVPPLSAAPLQFPYARSTEPSVTVGGLVNNPRDGLVTVLAYVRGEEWFSDDNANGARDDGLDGGIAERFIDQGEAFVDNNDDGTWNTGETFIDEGQPDGGPGNGFWDPPNDKWDSDKTIWTEARMLYTARPTSGAPYSFIVPNPFAGFCPGGVPKSGVVGLVGYFTDFNLNVPVAAGTGFAILHTATKGSVAMLNSGIQDHYGFGVERRLLNAATEQDCLATTPTCKWKVLFYDWQRPIGYGQVIGAAPTDTTPCENDSILMGCTVLGYTTNSGTSGAIR